MGISITDGAKLFKNGYSLSDMKELNIILDKNPDNSNDIVDLAKKLQFSDLKQALTLFSISADKPSENDNADEDDEDVPGDDEETQNKHTPADDHSEDDNIDYKKKYEEEKTLREKIQRANQRKDGSGVGNTKTPLEIALDIATDVLN